MSINTIRFEISFLDQTRDIKDMSLQELRCARDLYQDNIERLKNKKKNFFKDQTKKEEIFCKMLNRFNDLNIKISQFKQAKISETDHEYAETLRKKNELEKEIKSSQVAIQSLDPAKYMERYKYQIIQHLVALRCIKEEIIRLETESPSHEFWSSLRF